MMNTLNSKYKRGQKFEIEIAEVHTHYDDDDKPFSLYRVKGFASMVLTDIALDKLTRVKSNAIECVNCKYDERKEWEEPCVRCKNSHKNMFEWN